MGCNGVNFGSGAVRPNSKLSQFALRPNYWRDRIPCPVKLLHKYDTHWNKGSNPPPPLDFYTDNWRSSIRDPTWACHALVLCGGKRDCINRGKKRRDVGYTECSRSLKKFLKSRSLGPSPPKACQDMLRQLLSTGNTAVFSRYPHKLVIVEIWGREKATWTYYNHGVSTYLVFLHCNCTPKYTWNLGCLNSG